MDPLGAAASIASLLQLAGTVIKYLNGLKHSSEDIKRLVIELCTIRGLLLTIKDLVTEESVLHESLHEQDGLFSQIESSLQLLASKIGGSTTNTTLKLGTKLRWPLRKDDVKDTLSSIGRQKTLLSLALQSDQICVSRHTQSHMYELTQEIKELQVAQKDAKGSKILRWLHSPDPSINHNSACAEHSPTTGSWFINSEAFQSWWNKPNEFLWVHGLPGCGKSVLASTIIDHTRILCEDHPEYKLAYFYFDFRQDNQQTLDGFLRSTLVQLSHQASVLPHEIRKLYDQHESKNQQPSVAELTETFISVLRHSQPFYLIVDALDECSTILSPGRGAVLSLLKRIKTEKLEHVNILILSRQVRDIEDGLHGVVTNIICIQNKAVDADIKVHVARLLADDSRLRKWSPMVKEEIEASLVLGARGMFRWAVCQIEVLRKCLSVSVLRHALRTLPETLDETYDRVLMDIPREYHREAYSALQILSVAGSCVSVADVAEAVAVDRMSCTFDPEDRFADPFDIVEVLSTLVTYSSSQIALRHEEPLHGHFPGAERATEIRLAHYSVKEYLQSDRIRSKSTSKFYISSYEAEKCAAETCLTYLLWLDQPDSVSAELLLDFPFGLYAAEYWYHHAYLAYNCPDHEYDRNSNLTRLTVELFSPEKSSSYINWLRLCDPYRVRDGANFSRQLNNMAPPVNYACYLGLLEIVRVLRDAGTDIHASAPGIRESAGRTPLSNAVVGRHEGVIRFLLGSGVDVNPASDWGRTALHQASLYGDVNTVRLLLAHGADLDVKTGPAVPKSAVESPTNDPRNWIDKGDNPAQWMSGRSETAKALTQHLIQKKMYLESRPTTLKPLGKPHEFYRGSVLNILLYGGYHAEINSITGWTPLHEAAWGGHAAIIRVLKDADIEAQTRYGWTPLQMAAYNGHEAAVQALVDAGANVNARNCYGWTALHAASISGHEPVVRVLLDNKADIESETEYGWTPLFGALENEGTMTILLERGANLNANNSYGGTILHIAARVGLEWAVKLLLSKGIDRDIKTVYGTTALQEATLKGHDAIIRLLQSLAEPVDIQQALTKSRISPPELRRSVPEQTLDVANGSDSQDPCQELRSAFRIVTFPWVKTEGEKGNGTAHISPSASGQLISVLFVCLGNFCRSPIAEAVLRSLTTSNPRVSRIDSAGIGAVGGPPDPRTMSTLEDNGILDYHHEGRNIQAADFTSFDYILAMNDRILYDLQRKSHDYGISVGAKAKVMLFGDFGGTEGEQIQDVYWGPREGFEAVYEQIFRLSKGFITKVLDGNGSGSETLESVTAEEQEKDQIGNEA